MVRPGPRPKGCHARLPGLGRAHGGRSGAATAGALLEARADERQRRKEQGGPQERAQLRRVAPVRQAHGPRPGHRA
eukprot:2695718-Prymnesium_polylepis.1